MVPTPPTGISLVVYNNRVELSWVKNPETDIKGYNVYNATTSGGGVSGYVKLNNNLVEAYSEIKQEILSENQVVQQSGNTKTITTQQTFKEVFIYKYSHTNITEKKKQYYVITAVNNIGEESVPSIEAEATPLIISTEVVTIPVRTQNDIALDYITELLVRDDKLDVKPGSVIRQLHVDPNSKEMSYAYIREDFAMRSQSFLNLRQLDDSNNDGISDLVTDSAYKQKLKQAYYYTVDADVQTLIDNAFDALASNYGKVRQGATTSSTYAVFYVSTPPTTDLTVALGAQISTVPTETEAAISFITLSSDIMQVSQIDTYYNAVTQRYELRIPIEAVVPGSAGNVNSNTIINTNIAGLSVTNPDPAFGGTDEESNADLADRAQLSFVGLDVGTLYGYKRTCMEIADVRDVIVIPAGHPMMQRDYDEVRHKHVYGKVDIYIRGGENSQVIDSFGFLYQQEVDEQFEVIDTADLKIRTSNPSVTISKPIFTVSEVRNVSKGKNYDLYGNWMISKNGILMQKTIEVSVILSTGQIEFVSPLVFGDIIMADYQYKAPIVGEVVIDPANGGEVLFSLQHFPIVKGSYAIKKNSVVLVENIDYFLNIANGFLQLAAGLVVGDAVIADYQYVISIQNEAVIGAAIGGETLATLAHGNLLESFLIESDGLTIDLEEHNTINASVGLALSDLVTVTYRHRNTDDLLLLTQPADEIISIAGSISGILEAEVNYHLNKIDDILLEGNSSKATRTVSIMYASGIPVGDLLEGTENSVLVNNEYRELSQFGIDTESIIVRNPGIVYLKNIDYLIEKEIDGKRVQIARSRTSSIPNGQEIIVDYQYGEVLTITYQSNPLIKIVQDAVDISRHVTADVLVKQVLETKLDFDISVILSSGADSLQVSGDIRTAVASELNKLSLGEGIAQSDIIRAIEMVANVKSVVVPLAKMVKSNGTQINREPLGSSFSIYQTNSVVSYTTGANALLQKTLGHLAVDGFYAIFEEDRPLILVSSPNDVDIAAGQGWIGSNGEIVVSTINSDSPSIHSYTVSYVVNGETGAKDIDITSLEFLSIGEIIITTA